MSLMATGPRCWQWQRGKDDVLAEGAGINNTAVVMRTDLCFNAAKRHGVAAIEQPRSLSNSHD